MKPELDDGLPVTTNCEGLVAVPPGVVTESVPVDEPAGTTVWICVGETTL